MVLIRWYKTVTYLVELLSTQASESPYNFVSRNVGGFCCSVGHNFCAEARGTVIGPGLEMAGFKRNKNKGLGESFQCY